MGGVWIELQPESEALQLTPVLGVVSKAVGCRIVHLVHVLQRVVDVMHHRGSHTILPTSDRVVTELFNSSSLSVRQGVPAVS